jgi:hypothetical protein
VSWHRIRQERRTHDHVGINDRSKFAHH